MVQSEIAQNVAEELKIRLVASEKEQLEKNATVDPVAANEYSVGSSLLNQRTPQSIRTAITHFEKAIDRDPAFTRAYANLLIVIP